MLIKKEELSDFYDEIKKQGGEVDKEMRQISFKISELATEHWVIKEGSGGFLDIVYERTSAWGGIAPQNSTKECREKIEKAIERIRKK